MIKMRGYVVRYILVRNQLMCSYRYYRSHSVVGKVESSSNRLDITILI